MMVGLSDSRGRRATKFSISVFGLVLTLLFFAIPIYHQVKDRDLRPVLTINLDSLSMLVGLLGIAVIAAVASLHRRIASLEKAISMGPKVLAHCRSEQRKSQSSSIADHQGKCLKMPARINRAARNAASTAQVSSDSFQRLLLPAFTSVLIALLLRS